MLNNLKISLKLGIGFAIPLILLVLVAGVGITRLAQLDDEMNLIVNDRFPKTVWANDMVDALNTIARSARNAALVTKPEDQQKELERIPEQRKILGERLDKLEKTITTPEGKALLAKMIESRKTYVPQQEHYIELIKAGKKAEALDHLLTTMRTTQNAYFKGINDLIAYQTELMNKAGKEANATYQAARTMMIALGVVAVLLTLVLAFIITRGITGPVGRVVEGAKKMAAGDFNFELKSDAKDEVGEVIRAVGSVQAAVQAMTADANMLAKAAVEGKLATRADASKHQGDFQAIVKGVNDTLDAVIGPLNVAATYVDRISKGDIPPKITDSYNGDFNTIKNNLNQAIDAVNKLIADANLLAKAAVDGKLATRADAAAHQGDFRKIVEGV
ncbi:MAG: MCP four helix bundle domain-containing protein, partial [Sterolibacteriaceae bacterium MAG5]|nr:MCP four helix bundle domain-containing protein [Candidatus Nitricoxidireducens bremensis]